MYISIFIYIYMYIIIIPITNVYTNTVINAAVTKEMKYLKFLCNYKTLIFKYWSYSRRYIKYLQIEKMIRIISNNTNTKTR